MSIICDGRGCGSVVQAHMSCPMPTRGLVQSFSVEGIWMTVLVSRTPSMANITPLFHLRNIKYIQFYFQQLNLIFVMENSKKWYELRDEKTTGRRVLVLTTLVNGICVSPADMGDEDAMRENNEF